MHIQFVEIRNFRKLKSIRIDFADETTLFVGANNSGKTSAIAALGCFLLGQKIFSANDVTLSNWKHIDEIGKTWETTGPTNEDWEALLPSLDLWLHVAPYEIHYVNHLLPTLDWEGGSLGIRLRLEPRNAGELYREYTAAISRAEHTKKSAQREGGSPPAVALWPRSLRDFLERRMASILVVRTYPLDPKAQELPENGIARPQPLPEGSEPIDGDPLRGLIRIDMIHAQRDFADELTSRDRLERIDRRDSRRLSAQLQAYYERHLNPLESPEPSDLDALEAIQAAEKLFDEKLRTGFSAALEQVEHLGYPGVTDPRLTISTRFRLTDGLDHKAAVQYDVLPGEPEKGTEPLRLPEGHNGLGYQNLISMVFRLMSFRDEWMQVGKAANKVSETETGDSFSPPPLHLVLIEEPEAHLHAQVQQVFVRKAYSLLRKHESLQDNPRLRTQLVISTHSSHVAHECDFSWLRYFRRRPASPGGEVPITTVVNLSEVFGTVSDTQRFVTRYLKSTHCDLFFADGAILVEGPAERILIPQFLRSAFPHLSKTYITLLEIGGSHAHRLRRLIEHLGLVTLIITDLDAMSSANISVPPSRGKGQFTRNVTLRSWVPEKDALDDLFSIPEEGKVKTDGPFFAVRVAYQCPVTVQLNGGNSPIEVVPNTFEDALAFENVDIFKALNQDGDLGKIRDALNKSGSAKQLAEEMFTILKKAKKAEMALDLLLLEGDQWPIKPPAYIRDGLLWLQEQMQNKQRDVIPPSESAVAQEATR